MNLLKTSIGAIMKNQEALRLLITLKLKRRVNMRLKNYLS